MLGILIMMKTLELIEAEDIREIFDEIDHKVRVHYGLIEDDAEDEKNAEATKSTNKVEEVTLDLDDAIEIEE